MNEILSDSKRLEAKIQFHVYTQIHMCFRKFLDSFS